MVAATETFTDAAGEAPPTPKGRRRPDIRSMRDAAAFLAPFLIVYALFLLIPVVQAFYMSGYDWDLLSATRRFVGLANFNRMLGGTDIVWSVGYRWLLRAVILLVAVGFAWWRWRSGARRAAVAAIAVGAVVAAVLGIHPSAAGSWNDPTFWTSLGNTVTFTVISTPLLVALGLGLALALHTKRRASVVYRTLFFLPYVLPISAVTLIWSYLLNPDRGLIAGFLSWFGVGPINFLSSPTLAMPSIIATTIWWSVGFNMVVYLAGLQDIDPTLHEAASLDGANAWQRFRAVTLPGLAHVSVLVIVTQFIASFQIFGQVYIMTRGGPGTATEVLIQQVYQSAFKNYQLGYAATLSVFLFVVMAAVSAIQFRFISRES
jgi:multiple sugar transport system permease protein